MEDKELKKRLKKIPDIDKNGDPIYKIDEDLSEKSEDELPQVGDVSNLAHESKFKDTLQDLKPETSEE
jgi:hypothetical protein